MKDLVSSLCFVGLIAAFLLNPLAPQADTFRPVVRGKRGAVAAGHPLSAEAGMRLLQQGGNAVDAGCAAILAASVIEFSHFSFGGEVPIIIKTAQRRSRLSSTVRASLRDSRRESSSCDCEAKKRTSPKRRGRATIFHHQAFFRRRCRPCLMQSLRRSIDSAPSR